MPGEICLLILNKLVVEESASSLHPRFYDIFSLYNNQTFPYSQALISVRITFVMIVTIISCEPRSPSFSKHNICFQVTASCAPVFNNQ
jgi:hypothetical protein